jgi:hypothetical protein
MTQSEMKAAAGFCSDFVEEARLTRVAVCASLKDQAWYNS